MKSILSPLYYACRAIVWIHLLAFPGPIFATECDDRLLTKIDNKIDKVMKILFYTSGLSLNPFTDTPNKYFDGIWGSASLRQYLNEHGQPWAVDFTEQEKYKYIAQYVGHYLAQYRDSAFLAPLEQAVAIRGLARKGVQVQPGENAQAAVKRISHTNFDRCMENVPSSSSSPLPMMATSVIDSLELFLAHNSHFMSESPGYPLVSPVELEKMGVGKFGMSSRRAFNLFLGSDHFVYFRVLFKQPRSNPDPRSEYGQYGVILQPKYALEHAVISPFVMDPPQLYEAVRGYAPVIADQLIGKISEKRVDGSREFVADPKEVRGPEEIRSAQAQLHYLNFTSDDFEKLVKALLKARLTELYLSDRRQYVEALASLRETKLLDLNIVIMELIGSYLKYASPMGFEAVVAVAVPENSLVYFSAASREPRRAVPTGASGSNATGANSAGNTNSVGK
jgi:hypothetical protein